MLTKSNQSDLQHTTRNQLCLFALLVTCILFLTGCQPVFPPPPAAPDVEITGPFHVLILNSYHIGYQWSEDIVKGINTAFSKGTIRPEVFVEYMDTKRYAPEDIYPSLIAMYASKYETTPLDLIITADNNALSFMATYHDQLFPDVPVVFLGVNGFTPEMLGSMTDVTGISESLDERATIDLILQLLPETRHLVTITDSTVTGEIHYSRFQELAKEYAGQLDFIFLADLSVDEMAVELSRLPDNSAIFFRSFFRSAEGESITVEEALRLIRKNTSAPIFTTWDFTLGEGVVGGALLTGQSQGEAAGNLALQILQGTPATSIPIMESSPTEIVLDYNELQRYNIPLSAVPGNSTIINQPTTFYHQYRTAIQIGIFFFAAQTLIITFLITAIRRRRKAEKELAAAEKRLDRMLQTVVDGVIVINRDVNISYINPAARRLLDIPDTFQTGDPFFDLIWTPIDDQNNPIPAESFPLISALKNEQETCNASFRLINPDGDIKWLAISAAPIVDENGQTISAIASLTDTTAQQFAVLDLQKSEKRFRTLFEQVVDAIIICELDGQILDVNQRACEMLGYSRSEILTISAFDLAGNISKEEILDSWKNIAKGTTFSKEGYQQTRNGLIFPVELSIGLIELEGQDRILIVSRDITERQQARQILLEERAMLEKRVEERTAELQRLNAELHKAARAKDNFLANMSHELRTPLNAVLGMSEMLGEELHGPLNEKQSKYIKIIENSGRHLLDLINDILDLSKIEAGQKNIEPQLIQVDDLCNSSLYFVQQSALSRGVEIAFQNNSQQTAFQADPRGAKQILVNLLTNAIKFSMENGRIDFTVDDAPEQNALRFTIRDHGIGIDPASMSHLFKPFSQIDTSLSRNYEGSGLGLALVSRLVNMHGGSTSLDSTGKPGEGSTFTVILPIDRQTESLVSITDWAAQYNDANPIAKTILLAEEDQTTIQFITSTLQPLGCQIDVARTGTSFLQQARKTPPQIFLLNMQIPEMEGWQILSILKEDSDLQNIPILCFTSLMITGDPQRYIDAGASAFLLKPFQIEALLEWLKAHQS